VARLSTIHPGMRFGRLVVIARSNFIPGNYKLGTSLWEVQCDCGCKKIVRGRNLNSGNTTSCGCFNKEQSKHYWQSMRLIGAD